MRVLLGFLLFLFVVGFQNCSNVGFSTSDESASNSDLGAGQGSSEPDDAFAEIREGLKDGHFDLDTSTRAYPLGAGSTNHHVHEYDDKFNLTYADFFNLADSKFDNIQEAVTTNTRFVLIIANAKLSPGGVININGQNFSVVDYQKKVDDFIAGNTQAIPVFTLSGASDNKLSALKIGFSANALNNNGLVGTETSCVVGNDPGKLGEYRNGALTIQAIALDTLKINPATRVADLNGGLMWESTIFWHWDQGCYN